MRPHVHDPETIDLPSPDGPFRVWRWPGASPPIVFLHGFSGTGRDVEAVVEALGDERAVVAPDLWGHGDSPCPPMNEFTMARCATMVRSVLDAMHLESGVLLGYSMGARLALQIALQAPARWKGLVLVGGHAGIRDPADRDARRRWDVEMAATATRLGQPGFAEHWEALPIISSQERTPEPWRSRLRDRRRRADVKGLACALEGIGAGAMPPLWDRLNALTMPTLVVAGEQDTKYVSLGRTLVEALPNATPWWATHCGHAPHLESPQAFADCLRRFLDHHAPLPGGCQGAS